MTARDSQSSQRLELLTLLGPVVAALGYDLEDLSVATVGRRSVIRVIVDSDAGIDLDGVADVSREISVVLDDESGSSAFSGPFVLEVSSPGVDRPLVEARHWRRAVGRLVRTTRAGVDLRGRVLAATSASVTFDVDMTSIEVPLDQLGVGHLEIEFSRRGDRDGAAADVGPNDISQDETDTGDIDPYLETAGDRIGSAAPAPAAASARQTGRA